MNNITDYESALKYVNNYNAGPTKEGRYTDPSAAARGLVKYNKGLIPCPPTIFVGDDCLSCKTEMTGIFKVEKESDND